MLKNKDGKYQHLVEKQRYNLLPTDMDRIMISQQLHQTIYIKRTTSTESDIIDKYTKMEWNFFCNN